MRIASPIRVSVGAAVLLVGAGLNAETTGNLLANPSFEDDWVNAKAEKQLIIRTLKECRGNRTAAARKIGISRRTLHRKLNRYGLEGI